MTGDRELNPSMAFFGKTQRFRGLEEITYQIGYYKISTDTQQ